MISWKSIYFFLFYWLLNNLFVEHTFYWILFFIVIVFSIILLSLKFKNFNRITLINCIKVFNVSVNIQVYFSQISCLITIIIYIVVIKTQFLMYFLVFKSVWTVFRTFYKGILYSSWPCICLFKLLIVVWFHYLNMFIQMWFLYLTMLIVYKVLSTK